MRSPLITKRLNSSRCKYPISVVLPIVLSILDATEKTKRDIKENRHLPANMTQYYRLYDVRRSFRRVLHRQWNEISKKTTWTIKNVPLYSRLYTCRVAWSNFVPLDTTVNTLFNI